MIQTIMSHYGCDKFETMVMWLMLTYTVVMFCMAMDLAAGIRKAKQRGEFTTSKGLRKTAEKAMKYFEPMICLTFIDVLASSLIDFPIFTMLMGAYNSFCEFKSIFESTHQKSEILDAANTMQVIVKNKDDLASMFLQIMEQMKVENLPQPINNENVRRKSTKADKNRSRRKPLSNAN